MPLTVRAIAGLSGPVAVPARWKQGLVTEGVDHQVGVALLRLDRLLRLAAWVVGRTREQGWVTLGNQEVIRDAVSVVRGEMTGCGLNGI